MLRHVVKRGAFLFVTLVVAMYVVVLVANLGGKIDEILVAQIRFDTAIELGNRPDFQRLPPEEQNRLLNQTIQTRLAARGLDQPFVQRSFVYTRDALTLNLGRAMFLKSNAGSSDLFTMIMERLPITVLLFTTGTVLSAFFGILLGLRMARRALKVFDRGMTVFSVSTFIVPHWIFGILFILAFGFSLRLFPTRGFVDVPPPPDIGGYMLSVMYHMALPLFTVVFSSFGYWAYITRNLVLQIMEEDFVKAAYAKGLPERTVLHKYVLRAASPPLVTSISLSLIASWTGAIITET
ncbi:MAG: ABC transporter permease subunit, partial [Anaerolineae bacterium]|nr:ABC transporter permease subunit [Anaerolineae bacterium]